jgi:hypothetical protein
LQSAVAHDPNRRFPNRMEKHDIIGARSWVRFFLFLYRKGRNDWTYISAFLDSIMLCLSVCLGLACCQLICLMCLMTWRLLQRAVFGCNRGLMRCSCAQAMAHTCLDCTQRRLYDLSAHALDCLLAAGHRWSLLDEGASLSTTLTRENFVSPPRPSHHGPCSGSE